MKVIEITQTHKDVQEAINNLKVVEKPTPEPGPGQVLVKIEAAPCNPADLLFIQGSYGVKKRLPAVPGWEGAGTVVKNGGGFLGWWLQGKRVACGGQSERDGTWAEYYVAEANSCIPLKEGLPIEQGATLIVNPLTAIGLVDQAVQEKHRAIIQTAACSQVGRMVQALANDKKIPLINIVRRTEQVEELQAQGEKWILNSEDPEFHEQLKDLSHRLKASIVFEAVAGSLTGVILSAMPENSKAVVYGSLSGKSCEKISPLDLIFKLKSVEGFWVRKWIQKQHFWQIFKQSNLIQNWILEGRFQTKINQTSSIDNWAEALILYQKNMTAGKVVLVC